MRNVNRSEGVQAPVPLPQTPNREIAALLARALSRHGAVLFAYFYGSAAHRGEGNDIDIAVFWKADVEPHRLSANLEIDLSKTTGLAPDIFDVRILNGLEEHSDLFGLLFLRDVLNNGRVLIDADPNLRSEFLERYGSRFRECEGRIQEILA